MSRKTAGCTGSYASADLEDLISKLADSPSSSTTVRPTKIDRILASKGWYPVEIETALRITFGPASVPQVRHDRRSTTSIGDGKGMSLGWLGRFISGFYNRPHSADRAQYGEDETSMELPARKADNAAPVYFGVRRLISLVGAATDAAFIDLEKAP